MRWLAGKAAWGAAASGAVCGSGDWAACQSLNCPKLQADVAADSFGIHT